MIYIPQLLYSQSQEGCINPCKIYYLFNFQRKYENYYRMLYIYTSFCY